MKLKNYLNLPSWILGEGEQSSIVLTSRIRLARNLSKYNFPHRSTREEKLEILEDFRKVITANPFFAGFEWIELSNLTGVERQILLESHIISPPFMSEVGSGRAVLMSEDKSESMMINEEDHLRLQVVRSGSCLKGLWERADIIDNEFEKDLDYAFSNEFGYKTTCPTNVGTAMRASSMLHLPALSFLGQLKSVMDYISQIGLLVRGMFGEGTDMAGSMIQISNQYSANFTEEEIIEKVETTTRQIIDKEKNAREKLLFEQKSIAEDITHRNLAILKSARILPINEFMDKFSTVRMGVETKILPEIPLEELNKIFLLARPAYVRMMFNLPPDQERIDMARAELVRKSLENVSI